MSLEQENLERYLRWEYSPEGIHYNLGTSRTENDVLDAFITETISVLPHDIIDWIVETCVFRDSNGGIMISLKYFHNRKFLIVLPEELLKKPKSKIRFTIAHEIAHAKLNHHENSSLDTKQEEKADELARKWLSVTTPTPMHQEMGKQKEPYIVSSQRNMVQTPLSPIKSNQVS